VAVTVRSTGRLPVSVTGWGINVGKVSLGHVDHPINRPLPHRLEHGESGTWIAPIAEILALIETHRDVLGEPDFVVSSVRLGDGHTVKSRDRVRAASLA
jgi:hypothetical protein